MATTERTSYTQSLHALADLLDNNPIPAPNDLNNRSGLTWYIHDSIETVLAIRDLMDEAITLPYVSNDFPVEVTGTLAGFPVSLMVAREIALAGAPAREVVPMNPRLLGLPAMNK